ncbi:DUF1178 family protein [Roseibium aestuarii]|uniref:DUF1178 family protein n=1 Tax=Roseibium aestuarii TaxID=2600299 RepID=A0ABW4JUS8_9HYPH|nr:DUF1178 family protein [Roseibium aestuarii]
MIRYRLVCDQSHDFEAWFRNSEDFDTQSRRKLVTCPQCGSATVGKGLMAPSVSTSRKQEQVAREMAALQGAGAPEDTTPAQVQAPAKVPVPQPAPAAASASLMTQDPRIAALVEGVRALRTKLLENSDYVGTDFAEEARRIHYGEAEARTIHGETSLEDARELIEEGVSLVPIPVLPDDQN